MLRGTSTTTARRAGMKVAIDPAGRHAFVAAYGGNTIHAIDLTTRTARRLELAGHSSVHGIVAGTDAVWVTAEGSVAILDRQRREVVASIQVGTRPLGLGFSADGSRGYVTRPGASEIVEIDVSTREIIRRIPTDASPDGVVWLPR